jgi:hypothetical protein
MTVLELVQKTGLCLLLIHTCLNKRLDVPRAKNLEHIILECDTVSFSLKSVLNLFSVRLNSV